MPRGFISGNRFGQTLAGPHETRNNTSRLLLLTHFLPLYLNQTSIKYLKRGTFLFLNKILHWQPLQSCIFTSSPLTSTKSKKIWIRPCYFFHFNTHIIIRITGFTESGNSFIMIRAGTIFSVTYLSNTNCWFLAWSYTASNNDITKPIQSKSYWTTELYSKLNQWEYGCNTAGDIKGDWVNHLEFIISENLPFLEKCPFSTVFTNFFPAMV